LKKFIIGFEVVIGHLMIISEQYIYKHKKERNSKDKRQISGESISNIKISRNIKKIINNI